MTFARSETFRSIDQTLAADVLPALYRSQKLPLRISCLGIAGYDASEAANSFDRVIRLGECPSPEEAIQAAALRLSRGHICTGRNSFPYFQPRIMLIQDRDQRLVLAGEVRASIILWQQPVASDAEARRIVTEASRLRGMAFRTRAHAEALALRCRAAVLEGPSARFLLARNLGPSPLPAAGGMNLTHSTSSRLDLRRAFLFQETDMADSFIHFSCLRCAPPLHRAVGS